MYEKTFVTGIPLRSPQIEPLMIFVFTSASLWGCLGCEELPDWNISTELLEEKEKEESIFEIQRINSAWAGRHI